jgi:hypothetical protein
MPGVQAPKIIPEAHPEPVAPKDTTIDGLLQKTYEPQIS